MNQFPLEVKRHWSTEVPVSVWHKKQAHNPSYLLSGRWRNSLAEASREEKGKSEGGVCTRGMQGKKEGSQAGELAREPGVTHLCRTIAHVFVHCVPKGDNPHQSSATPPLAAGSRDLGRVGWAPTHKQKNT